MVKELQGVTAPPVHWAHIYICRYVEGLMAAFDAVSQSGSHRIHIGHTGTSLSQTRTGVETAVAIVFPLYSGWAHWHLPISDTDCCGDSGCHCIPVVFLLGTLAPPYLRHQPLCTQRDSYWAH